MSDDLSGSRLSRYRLSCGMIAIVILAVLFSSVINRARRHWATSELQRMGGSIIRASGRPLGGSIDVGVRLSGRRIDDGALRKP